MKHFLYTLVLILISGKLLYSQLPLNYGSTGWKYYMKNSSPIAPQNYVSITGDPGFPGTYDWKSPYYNSVFGITWPSGATLPIGYGTNFPGGLLPSFTWGTALSISPYPITSYYRKTLTGISGYSSITINCKSDDASVVYLNGIEVQRSNLPVAPAPITSTTNANGGINSSTSSFVNTVTISGSLLASVLAAHYIPGNITVAVEVHQYDTPASSTEFSGSTDSFFDIEITGTTASATPTITRGPYLQLASDNVSDVVGIIRDPATTKQFRWATNSSIKGSVKYWIDTPGSIVNQSSETMATTDHLININGLTANKKYRYEIGYLDPISSSFVSLITSPDHFFQSGPQYMDVFTKKTKIWLTGDIGYNPAGYAGLSFAPLASTYNLVQNNVISGFNTWANTNINPSLDFWILLGDNAYLNGTSDDYKDYFFGPLQNTKMMKQATIIPALGNHEYYESRLTALPTPNPVPTRSGYTLDGSGNDRLSKNYAYYDLFKTPQKGQAGGVPSNSPSYYSFNVNNIHFIILDSYGADIDPITSTRRSLWENNSPQMAWLENDLIQNDIAVTNTEIFWTVVVLHHPPYTKGSYNSDAIHGEPGVFFNDGIMNAIANKLVRKLENHKVDMVLSGHSHVYERSKQLKGLYDATDPIVGPVSTAINSTIMSSATFKPHTHFNALTHQINTSTGKYDGSTDSCPYETSSNALASTNGIIYAVVGSGSTVQVTPKDPAGHKALPIFNYSLGGSMVLEMQIFKLVAKWIDQNGNVGDSFTIVKDIIKRPEAVVEISPLDLPSYSPSFQRIWDPSVVTGIPFTFTAPPPTPGSSFTFVPSISSYNIINPQIGPYYSYSDATGCLAQNIRFHFTPDCWPASGVNIFNLIDSPVPETIKSSGSLFWFNTIKASSVVNSYSVGWTGFGVGFHASPAAVFTSNSISTCP